MKKGDKRAKRRAEQKRHFAFENRNKAKQYQAQEKQRQSQIAARRKELGLPEQPDTFVGRLEYIRKGGIVMVDSKLLKDDIIVPTPFLHGATEGDKVVVRLTRRGSKRIMPEGEIIDILGKDGENNAEMHAILAEYGLPYSYPKEVADAADKIEAGITDEEISRRKDMREVLTFTIDPHDAKDFDDALSFRIKSESGAAPQYEIGVHIADVTHYVKQGSIIDAEAYSRATSVYLVDRTVPMLPEKLCNEICSLRPDEDKLTFSVIFTLDSDAHVLNYDICRTVIRSNHRLTYEQAQEILDSADSQNNEDTAESSLPFALKTINSLAKELRKRRFEQGAIDFDHEEVTFDIDEQGKPLAVRLKTSTDANHLIEEFMLLANRTVATHIGKEMKKLFVYRVHDVPDKNKLQDLSKFISRFGYKFDIKSNRKSTISKNINALLHQAKGSKEQSLIEMVTIRAMAKAVYSTDNIGHYGLAFRYYTHFTSPIRRYPDIMVHRLLTEYLSAPAHNQTSAEEYEQKCKHCSQREQLSVMAERASIKYKQAEFMQSHIGQQYDGIISGIVDWGIYVELRENKAEGLIPIRRITPYDHYHLHEEEFCLKGEATGTTFALGDSIRVCVTNADPLKRQLDLEISDKE